MGQRTRLGPQQQHAWHIFRHGRLVSNRTDLNREANVKQYLTQYPIAETAATAAIGACAAVGLTFLVPDPTWREHSGLTVPLLATALTFVLMFIERHFQERGHRMGANQAYVDSTTGLPSPRVAQ